MKKVIKKVTQKSKQKSENQIIDEEIKKAYKEIPAKRHNDFAKLIKEFA